MKSSEPREDNLSDLPASLPPAFREERMLKGGRQRRSKYYSLLK